MTGQANVIGISIEATTPLAAVESTLARAKSGLHGPIHFVNAFTISLANSNAALHDVLVRGVNFPDGKPLSIALRWRYGERGARQIRGPDFFSRSLDLGREQGVKHFLLGGSPLVLNQLAATITDSYPGVHLVGTFSPPFGEVRAQDLVEQDEIIQNAQPDIIWVGLGTPKQDFEVDRLNGLLGVTAIGVGAAFDFLSGAKREAPRSIRVVGLEWLFRLVSEPRRLWRRYLIGNVQFLVALGRDLRGGRS